MKTMEGERVPEVRFRIRRDGDWDELTTKDLFEGKRTVVFGLPGAFTPTCSSSHLPRYNELAGELRGRGIDVVACVSVNDAFVMEAWQRDQKADDVVMVPDGNGEFSDGLGMLVDKSDLGFGRRSWRYSMLVDDGVIEKMFVEPEVEGDPFEVSDADHMLAYLAGGEAEPRAISLVTRPGCAHCARAKELLRSHDLAFEEIVLGGDVTTRTLRALSGSDQVPQVFVDGQCIGSADALEAYLS